jgi:ubiquitin carboxyl-terminal hydrolase 47
MIHSGGTYGGHYYSYIKSFEDGKWYNFNDSSVSVIQDSAEEIIKIFGGSASAYMLMYKRVDGDEKLIKFSDEEIPDYLKEEIQAETEKLIED